MNNRSQTQRFPLWASLYLALTFAILAIGFYEAMTAPHPKVRYQVTPDPMRHIITTYLPKRMVDKIIAKRLGLMPQG